MSTIRPATLDDLPELVELLGVFVAASGYADLAPYDPDSAGATCAGLITQEQGIVFVAMADERMVGAAGGITAPAHWNRSLLTATELFLWVLPEQRDGTGRHLLAELRRWAGEAGAGALFMSALDQGARVDALYRRAGFRPVERLYVASV